MLRLIFFCQNPYALTINKPIFDEAKTLGYNSIWFIPGKVKPHLSFECEHTDSMDVLSEFKADAIIVPGNEVPHYLRGLKVQIFHGFAGEKKGHFRVRDYFDLYLTQGPFFTNKFLELKKKHRNFDVIQTGWSKMDTLFELKDKQFNRDEYLKDSEASKVILYAPTFSPKLTSAKDFFDQIFELINNKEYFLIIKFHDLMDANIIERYKIEISKYSNAVISKESSIIKDMIDSDLMISDTSSVVYEFFMLDKPVITLNTRTEKPKWLNITDKNQLLPAVKDALSSDSYSAERRQIIDQYHPYSDSNSSRRMLDAIKSHIEEHGVPEKRSLSFFRRMKIHKLFGKLSQ